jgi:hypothetical protein
MSETKVQEVEVNEGLASAQGFWEKNKKAIIGISLAIIVVAGGWIAYKNWVIGPKEQQAAESMFKAEEYFRNDSLDVALNGDGRNKGFLYVINNFGSTKAGNLAHFYAGNIYLKKGDYNNAVKHLKDFSSEAKQIQLLAYGRLADAYSDL